VKSLKIKYIATVTDNLVLLPEEMRESFDYIPKKLILNVGSWKREVNMGFSSELDRDTIGIQKNIFQKFSVPENLDYEIKIDGRNLCLGPVICYLVETQRKYITYERLEKLKVYYKNYDVIKGIIFISAVDQINMVDKTIGGFFFGEGGWKEDIFTYPGVVYRKADIPDEVYQDLINHIGDRIFNSYFFDKCETSEILSTYPQLKEHIAVKKHPNSPFEFEVIMQKDRSMQWSCSGIIAGLGKSESMGTNFLIVGYTLSCYEALKTVFRMNEKDTFLKQQEIINICIEVCKAHEKAMGNYGELAIDVLLDEEKNVWILEVNKTYDHRFPLYSINDTEMYYRIITKPFEYAKALAGF
jgi:hypothetical protein